MASFEPVPKEPSADKLSERELAVLCLTCGGLRGKEVGARLGIEAPTVRIHLMNARLKLGVGTNVDACLKAQELGIIRRTSS